MAIHHKLLVPTRINIPQLLAALGYDQRYINDHQDKYHYILHKILEQRIFDSSIEAEGYSPLHLDTLRTFLGRRYADAILNELVVLDIVQCDFIKLYGEKGQKAYGYRINPALASKASLQPVSKKVFDKKLRDAAYRYKQKWSKTILWKNLTQLGIRDKEAYAFIDAKLETSRMMLLEYERALTQVIDRNNTAQVRDVYREVYNSYSAKEDRFKAKHTTSSSSFPSSSVYSLIPVQLIEKELQLKSNQGITLRNYLESLLLNKYNADEQSIRLIAENGYFIEQPDLTSRVFTNLSNLSGELRQFLFHKRLPGTLVNLDIRNSQPYLLSLLLADQYAGHSLPATVANYINLTAEGKFYERMMELVGMNPDAITKRSRKEFKKTFFAKIFFCSTHYSRRTPEGKAFRQHFREVADIIDAYKGKAHEQLAITMQRREASIILKVIGSELQKRGIWFATIHDSVVVMPEHEEQVKELVRVSFKNAVGVAPTVESEYLSADVNPVRAKGLADAVLLKQSEVLLNEAVREDTIDLHTLASLVNDISTSWNNFFDD
ncbi:hypothetical protein [Hymenobacter sp. YC55]|uniref:hypothetical protein n=1 Tax=Hymenobacter sp. YC55 TaxID=3034019 RepID=UPI0023F9D1FD|nr:hypothetical protein [Hymenobacter sp. YC55]MDF7812861.1 hypothetical protein [Hymenobacter sp. YC55]